MKKRRWLPRFLLNFISYVLPPSIFFIQKKYLYQLAGFCLESEVKINSEVKAYGNGDVSIGKNTWIGIGTEFFVPASSSIVIGKNCDIAPRVIFLCGSHKVGKKERRAGTGSLGNINIGDGVWIGAKSILLSNVYLGNGVIVAAGSVVKSGKYPPDALIAGNPAKVKKYYS